MPAEHPEHRTDAHRPEDESDASSVDRLIGVYDADGTLTGELRYWIGARLGRAHCSLCDITHGLVSEKSAWRECRDTLPVPFDTYHRNDMPESVREVSGLTLPAVFAETNGVARTLIDNDELERCAGDPEALLAAIQAALAAS